MLGFIYVCNSGFIFDKILWLMINLELILFMENWRYRGCVVYVFCRNWSVYKFNYWFFFVWVFLEVRYFLINI